VFLAHKSEREHRKRAEKRKREFEEEEQHKHRHKTRERKFLTRFGRKMPLKITPFLIKTSESTYFVGKFSLTTNDALLERRRLIKREYEEGKIMSASCARCGYTIYLREASELISCQSCNLTHATETLFNDADDDDDENEDALVTTGGGKKMMKTISNAASFLYKFNIEPKNPDGTKIGSERDDENVSRERRATVDEPCPKCDNHVLRFYTMQLRSADEGQTVFYECEKCKHTFSQNN
jgi:DNA-directed RNA polymerase I subunit RPA12